jgi:hypothetical protein
MRKPREREDTAGGPAGGAGDRQQVQGKAAL